MAEPTITHYQNKIERLENHIRDQKVDLRGARVLVEKYEGRLEGAGEDDRARLERRLAEAQNRVQKASMRIEDAEDEITVLQAQIEELQSNED